MTIEEKLRDLKEKGEGALAMFATAGDPDGDTSLEIFRVVGESGADLIEIGVPYSDPLMDGPILQQSYKRALSRGFKLKGFPNFIESVRKSTDVPILIMTCYNPVYRYGMKKFFKDITSAGVDSVLLTDLPPEEWGEGKELASRFNLGTVFLVTPTTQAERMKKLDELSHPFLYCVSKIGITGSAASLPDELKDYVKSVRDVATNPVLVGFGISSPEHAALVGDMAEGVVVGSALVDLIAKNADNKNEMYKSVEQFVGGLKQALRK